MICHAYIVKGESGELGLFRDHSDKLSNVWPAMQYIVLCVLGGVGLLDTIHTDI